MKLKIEIELDNAAFADEEEIARLLADLAARLPIPLTRTSELSLLDSNGNWCGYGRIVQGKIKEQR